MVTIRRFHDGLIIGCTFLSRQVATLSVCGRLRAASCQGFTDPEDADGDYGIQIYHDAQPELQVITTTTQLLRDKAEELGGSYDGWETRVETPSAGGAPDLAH